MPAHAGMTDGRYVIPAKAGIQPWSRHVRAPKKEPRLGERTYAVYIMASRRNGTLYVGVTNNIPLPAHQHRSGSVRHSLRNTK
jgi:hypothetical protein